MSGTAKRRPKATTPKRAAKNPDQATSPAARPRRATRTKIASSGVSPQERAAQRQWAQTLNRHSAELAPFLNAPALNPAEQREGEDIVTALTQALEQASELSGQHDSALIAAASAAALARKLWETRGQPQGGPLEAEGEALAPEDLPLSVTPWQSEPLVQQGPQWQAHFELGDEHQFVEDFVAQLQQERAWPEETLRTFWAALTRFPVTLLLGPPGSMKSSLVQSFAERFDVQLSTHAVERGWSGAADVIGEIDPLNPRVVTLGPVGEAIYLAQQDPERLHVLLLDELNLSPSDDVLGTLLSELYVAPGRPRSVRLCPPMAAERLAGGEIEDWVKACGGRLPWPENLRVVGSGNEDGNTTPVSDRLRDRAPVLSVHASVSSEDVIRSFRATGRWIPRPRQALDYSWITSWAALDTAQSRWDNILEAFTSQIDTVMCGEQTSFSTLAGLKINYNYNRQINALPLFETPVPEVPQRTSTGLGNLQSSRSRTNFVALSWALTRGFDFGHAMDNGLYRWTVDQALQVTLLQRLGEQLRIARLLREPLDRPRYEAAIEQLAGLGLQESAGLLRGMISGWDLEP